MKRPFFSILLPTKNRSEIVGDAIASALHQTFADFELVISDNDDSDTATAKAVARHPDERIRYHRTTGKLPMHENWDNAFAHATGDHVLILEDKMRLVPNALEILRHYLAEHGDVPICYPVKFAKEPTIAAPALFPAAHFLDSRGTIEKFCRFSQEFFETLPKGLDSCVPRKTMEQIKARSPTGYLFSYICPDYSFGFMLLSQVDRFLRIKAPLIYVPNNWMWRGMYSNGQSSYKKDSLVSRFLGELPVKTEEITSRVPVKSHWLWINCVLYDFTTKYQRPGHQPQIDWVRYHGFCLLLVMMGRKVGGDMSLEMAAIKKSLRQQGGWFTTRVLTDFAGRLLKNGLAVVVKKLDRE